MIEEKAGRQFQDDMTPARATRIGQSGCKGKAPSRKETRRSGGGNQMDGRPAVAGIHAHKPETKGWRTDRYRYQKFFKPASGARSRRPLPRWTLTGCGSDYPKPATPDRQARPAAAGENHQFWGEKGPVRRPGLQNRNSQGEQFRDRRLDPGATSSSMEAIDQEPDIQAANFMKMALFTGMRRGELFKLQWEDMDFDRGFIHIRGPKGGQDQKIPLNPAARELL